VDRELLYNYIKENGFRTKKEVFEKFNKENSEVTEMMIDYLSAKNFIIRVKYSDNGLTSELYIIPSIEK
jgi:regulator of sigma D